MCWLLGLGFCGVRLVLGQETEMGWRLREGSGSRGGIPQGKAAGFVLAHGGGKKVKGGAQDFSLFSLWVVVAACRELDCLPLAAVEVAVGKTTTRPVLCSIS
jgi:hypothetical protein